MTVCSQYDTNRQNLQHALHIVNYILAQFGEQESHFFKDNDKNKAFEMVTPHFKDITYICILVIRSEFSLNKEDELLEN